MTFGWLSDGKLRTYPTGTSAFLSGVLMTETDSWSAAKKVLHIGVAAQRHCTVGPKTVLGSPQCQSSKIQLDIKLFLQQNG